jgi:ABC-type uncharacterized transport system permease subunit
VPAFGVGGAAVAFAACETLALSGYLTVVVQRKFGFSAWRHWLRGYSAGVGTFLLSYATATLTISHYSTKGLVGIAGGAVAWAVLAIPLSCPVLFGPTQCVSMLGVVVRRLRASSA